MNISIVYDNGNLVLPNTVISKLDRATKRDLKILFSLCASEELLQGNDCIKNISEIVGLSESEVESSIAFWRGAGVIDVCEDDTVESNDNNVKTDEKDKKGAKKVSRSHKKPELPDELPNYTTSELTALLEKRHESAMLIDECQRAFGKMFNPHEISIALGLQDYLGLDSEYIILLFAHSAKMGKRSLQYIKKMAFSLYDEGVTQFDALSEHLTKIELAATLEGEIRKLFNMKSRELSTKEKKFISAWVGDYGYKIDVIKKAYEMTVDAIHEPSLAYANAIISRWHRDGLNDLAAIESANAEKLPSEGSFDTNDFFNAALKRSFRDDEKK